jgi:hypothetical protein
MTAVIALIILTGAACASPVEQVDRATVAHKVPCAIVIREPVGNPFKLAQQPNAVTVPPMKTAAKKPARCNGGKVIWLKKKITGKRRYRCA